VVAMLASVEPLLTSCAGGGMHRNEIRLLRQKQPPETGIGGVGNKKVTSKRDHRYQRLDGEAGISCYRQQVSGKSQVT
jgi:hypothetical protein